MHTNCLSFYMNKKIYDLICSAPRHTRTHTHRHTRTQRFAFSTTSAISDVVHALINLTKRVKGTKTKIQNVRQGRRLTSTMFFFSFFCPFDYLVQIKVKRIDFMFPWKFEGKITAKMVVPIKEKHAVEEMCK